MSPLCFTTRPERGAVAGNASHPQHSSRTGSVPASARHLYRHLCLHLHLSMRENLRPRVSPFAPPGSYATTYVCTPAYPCHRTEHLRCACTCSLRRRPHPPPCTCARQTPVPVPVPAPAPSAWPCARGLRPGPHATAMYLHLHLPNTASFCRRKKTPHHGRNEHRATPARTCLPLPPQGSSPTPSGRDHCQIPAGGKCCRKTGSTVSRETSHHSTLT